MDRHTPEQRHKNMQAVKSKDTKIELILRKELWKRGLRYRKNDNRLPGRPDIVLPKYKTVVFVHGCFWHLHDNCKYARIPKSNIAYWVEKLNNNKKRDFKEQMKLQELGWNVIVVWECELKKNECDKTIDNLYKKIISNNPG